LKELFDNLLDACEEEGVAPQVSVALEAGKIIVTDKWLRHPRRDYRGCARLFVPRLKPGSLCLADDELDFDNTFGVSHVNGPRIEKWSGYITTLE